MNKQKRNHAAALKARGLTASGKDWIIQTLDPFHDTAIRPTGFPDMDPSNTLIFPYEAEMTIGPPANVTSGNNWDCHMFNLSDLATNNYSYISNQSQLSGVPTPANTVGLGFFNIVTMQSGVYTFGTGAQAAQTNTFKTLSVPTKYMSGQSRVVGYGFEVYNSTAEMYKQGMVNVYRISQANDYSNRLVASGTAGTNYPMVEIKSRMIPNSLNDIHSLQNTTEWDASSGVYVVGSQFSTTNPLTEGIATGTRAFVNKDSGDVTTESGLFCSNVTAMVSSKPINYDSSGAYFTGLSYQTTLTVKLKVFIEYVPTYADGDLMKFSRQSPAYDLMALSAYGRAISKLPPGVKVGENPLGEWFARVVQAIGNYGTTIGTALSPMLGPEAAIIGKAASTAAQAYQGIAKNTNQKIRALKDKENKVAQKVKTLENKVKKVTKQVAKKK